ncbi:MAG TPA: hypothetical protein VD886_13180 [Herpetosiphonaceae bacterium]|nr:hypothetical protein [Herpetosiphonaceae bacterium]
MRLIKFVLIALILAACGAAAQPTAQPTAAPDPLAFGTEPTTIVLEHRAGGGFRMPLYNQVLSVPLLRIYGDGRAIYQRTDDNGVMQWQETTFAPAELRALLLDVLGPKDELCTQATIPTAPVADAGDSTITVNLLARTCGATVDAVFAGAEQREGITPAGATLLAQMQHADEALQNVERQAAKAFTPEAVTVYTMESGESPDAIAWPLAADSLRDGNVIKGADAVALLEKVSTPKNFSVDGKYVMAVAVPILP